MEAEIHDSHASPYQAKAWLLAAKSSDSLKLIRRVRDLLSGVRQLVWEGAAELESSSLRRLIFFVVWSPHAKPLSPLVLAMSNPFSKLRLVHLFWLVVTAAFLSLGSSLSRGDDLQELLRLRGAVQAKMLAGDFKGAEPGAKELVEFAEKTYRNDAAVRIIASCDAVAIFDLQGKHLEADPHMYRALFLLDYVPAADGEPVLPSLELLGMAYSGQKRYAQAEMVFKKLVAIGEQLYGPRDPRIAKWLVFLGLFAHQQGRLADAEAWYTQARAIQTTGGSRVDLAMVEMNLAFVYLSQHRLSRCEQQAKRVIELSEKTAGMEAPLTGSLDALAQVAEEQGRFADAEPLLNRGLQITGQANVLLKPAFLAAKRESLGRLHRLTREFPRANQELTGILADLEREYGPGHMYLVSTLCELSRLREDEGKLDEAQAFLDRAVGIRERWGGTPFHVLVQRAKVFQKRNSLREMESDLQKALALAESQRVQASGNESDRARNFSRFSTAYEMLLAHHIATGDAASALAASERWRARSLVDQLQLRGIDWLAGIAPQTARELQWKENLADVQLASLQSQWIAISGEDDERRRTLAPQLEEARRKVVEAGRDIRNASPAYRRILGKDFAAVTLQELTAWCEHEKTAILDYWIGDEKGFVLCILPGQEPAWTPLEITPAQAESLSPLAQSDEVAGANAGSGSLEFLEDQPSAAAGITAGPLTRARLSSILINRERSGVIQELRKARPGASLTRRQATLYQVLIPSPLRDRLTNSEFTSVAVIPDGGLEMLPLETLVVKGGATPEYLLDVAPPILYAPSASFLLRQSSSQEQRQPSTQVVTLGDVDYSSFAATPLAPSQAASARGLYATARGGLQPLPYTAWETTWVAEVFEKKGLSVTKLTKKEATEAAIRKAAVECRMVHLACHGLADQAHGNAFGALVVTPGKDAADPRNDGYLTLAELYELDLRRCELAILSACETNAGPSEQGEGVFALSRGFLVAGSRRVIASNWLVDDEAGATLVSYFCRGLDEKQPDYARALREARLAVKKQEKWKSPFYWAPLVLVGPR